MDDFGTRPVLPALVVLGVLALLLCRPRLGNRLTTLGGQVRRLTTDRFVLTLEALVITFVIALPIPVFAWFVGWRLRETGEVDHVFAAAVGAGLLWFATVFYGLRVFAWFCKHDGLAEAHFRWREKSLVLLRRHTAWFGAVISVCVFVVATTENQPSESIHNSFGRAIYVVGMISQAVFVQRLFRPDGEVLRATLERSPDGWLSRLRYVWYPLVVGLPVALAVAAVLGYFYTAIALEWHVISTAWLFGATIAIHGTARRWLLVEARRLAIEQAQLKREEEAEKRRAAGDGAEVSGESSQPEFEIPKVDISRVNAQSRHLLRTLTGFGIALGLWVIWSPILPALGILDSVQTPWIVDVITADGTTVSEPITLQDVALALIALILTITTTKNLPGVLEILVLKNLPVDAGMRYALSTLSRYLVTVVGIVVSFKMIGIGWNQVQWLAAALSLGIGFGLQEIVANFFCGLILLFEQPIRVGDVVRVGDVTGTVTRIRIRATTITNWDRMEYVIPNRDLITGRLLNWTLSNTINRVVITVGAAYGSDITRARDLLLAVAKDRPLIMDDPGPSVTFDGFGDSTLNLTLRCYLPDFDNRLAVLHELHSKIHTVYADANIEIAFPQMDIHVKADGLSLPLPGGEMPQHTATKKT